MSPKGIVVISSESKIKIGCQFHRCFFLHTSTHTNIILDFKDMYKILELI